MMRHTFLSFLCLLMGFLLIPVVWYKTGNQWAMLYGTFIFLGWITGIILGKSFKTLPFIVWNDHYKHLSGKVKVPLPKQLYDERIVEWQFWFFVAALLALAAGILFANVMMIRFALLIWLMVALLYNVNVFKTLTHKTKIIK